jgi:small subunit ribosomal protein S6
MKDYELTVLIHPDLESDLEKALEKIRSLVAANGGEIAKEDNWGKKKLAYKINGEDFAVYVAMDVKLPAAAPAKISNTLNITDEVLRYLLVKAEERAEVAEEAEEK